MADRLDRLLRDCGLTLERSDNQFGTWVAGAPAPMKESQ